MSDGPRMISIEKIESDLCYRRTQLPKRKAPRSRIYCLNLIAGSPRISNATLPPPMRRAFYSWTRVPTVIAGASTTRNQDTYMDG